MKKLSEMTDEERYGKVGAEIRRLDPEAYKNRTDKSAEANLALLKRLRGAIELQGLSPRAVNVLGRHGIRTRKDATGRDVLALTYGERNCGAKTRSEIKRWLDANDFPPAPADTHHVAMVREANAPKIGAEP
ncbi:MAG: hypothetical protein EBV06_18240 [Planctomycetia bacterium]|nr:hypothetical protein [Planctomycetia bacterium]